MHPGSSDPMLGTPGDKILPNRNFRDMKDLADLMHSLGLRAGIYPSPGPCACGAYNGLIFWGRLKQ